MRSIAFGLAVVAIAGCSLAVSTSGLSGGATTPDAATPSPEAALPIADAAPAVDVEAGPVVVPGLIGKWDFDDGSARDSSGQLHDGALTGDATIVASDHGKSLQFAGNGGMAAGGLDGARFPTNGTIALRFQWSSLTHDNESGIFDAWDDPRDHVFLRYANGAQVGTMQIAFQTPGDYVFQASFNTLKATWVFVVIGWDSTNKRGVVFVDGKKIDDSNWSRSWTPAQQEVSFGFDLHGMIDDIQLFDRVLTDAEMAAL